MLNDLGLPEEDAASLSERRRDDAVIEIAVVRLPHISNFDEFGPLAAEPNVWVRYVQTASALRAPDLVILPGSKATLPDVAWLHERGLARRIQWLARHGTPVLGVCGGFQMLGQRVADPSRYESDLESAEGLALLPISTELLGDKTLRQVAGLGHNDIDGFWSCLRGQPVTGYEIHVGVTPLSGQAPLPGSRRSPGWHGRWRRGRHVRAWHPRAARASAGAARSPRRGARLRHTQT